MANSVCEVLLTEARLEAPKKTVDCTAGAIVEFWGVVRELEDGREIEGIDYEAHTAMATHQLQMVADMAAEKFQLKRVIVHHRTGFVPAGEASLFLQARAPHRAAAFDASKWIVEELKEKVPIWKRPRFRIESRPRTGSATPATATPAATMK